MPKAKSPTNSKLLLGLALLIFGAIFIFGRPERILETSLNPSFADEPVKIQGFDESVEGELPVRVVIPTLSIDLEVDESKVTQGYWEVFPDKAGWGEGSGLPGREGNQVIFAHAREGLFLPLRSIEVGHSVYVFTEEDWFAYEVVEIKEVFPNQVEVIAPTEDETLTLYTCSGFNDSKRLIVVAKRAE